MTTYRDFLHRKLRTAQPAGFKPSDLNPNLFDWQKELVRWFCRLGRAGCFADTGLGKTLMQLEWARQVVNHTHGKVLILTPLAVAQQTVREAEKFDVRVPTRVCREQSGVGPGVNIANYERLHKFDPAAFSGVVLDESSILKAYTGTRKRQILSAFRDTQYKLACTATPAPNDHLELGNHAEFLGIMPSSEMISRWFINDTMAAGSYRLKHYAAADFWRWVTSWAVCIQSPGDLGYPNADFILPAMEQTLHTVDSKPPAGFLFHCQDVSATNMHGIKRASTDERAAKVAEIVGANPGCWLVWCDTNYEADALRKALAFAAEVRGSDSLDRKEDTLHGFSRGEIDTLITKPEIAGHGLNWQHCHKMVFMGLSFSFERFYQAVRRCWRYGQTKPVEVHVVASESELGIHDLINRKAEAFALMRHEMAAAVREDQLANIRGQRKLREAPTVKEKRGKGWVMFQGDAVEAIGRISESSIGLTIFSPPFSNLYIYSDSIADMGNTADDAEFFKHFDYLIPELLRVTIPGRLCCVHCKDLPLYFNRDGAAGLRDFPGEIIRRFEAAGWVYHSRVTIWKDPVIEMQRTKNNGLLHKTLCRDSSQVRQGMADYVVVFRRPTSGTLMSDRPIERPHSRRDCFKNYAGEREAVEASAWAKAGEPKRGDGYGLEVWQRYASPVWFDIDQTRVLNYRQAKADRDEKHICPLQLDVIDRCVELWSAPGDVVFSPFAGIGSEGYGAVKAGRRFVGVELKESYFDTTCRNLRLAATKAREAQQTLFVQEEVA
jgi:DNA modification methylase